MCALFRSGVTIRQEPLAFDGGSLKGEVLAFEMVLHSAELLEARAIAALPPFNAPEIKQADLSKATPEVHPGPSLRIDPPDSAHLAGRSFLLTTKLRELPPEALPKVHSDLAYARRLPVLRRGVPPRLLTDDQLTYWIKRLADSKRINPRLVQLVAVFPDMQLETDRPVSYRADENALAFTLPEKPVQPSTVVVARHSTTGEPIQGRFYRDGDVLK